MSEPEELPRCWDDEDGDHLWIVGHPDDAVVRRVFEKWRADCQIDLSYEIGSVRHFWHLSTVPDDELLHEVGADTPGAEAFTRIELSW